MIESEVRKTGKVLRGIGLSAGVAAGTACRLEVERPRFYRLRIESSEIAPEVERFWKALDESRRQLETLKEKFEAQVGREQSYIIDAHLLILEDARFLQEIEEKIRLDLASPERALREAAERWLEACRSIRDPYFREKGSDLEEVIDRITANLLQLRQPETAALPDELILVAPSISLSVLADFELRRIKALVTTRGGTASHMTIVARSCRIPVVAGIEGLPERIHTGQKLLVDGDTGTVHVEPSVQVMRRYRRRLDALHPSRPQVVSDLQPLCTQDGRRIRLFANAEVENDVQDGLRLGGEGIGLFRSEFVYLRNKTSPVSEEEQFSVYAELAEAAQERPVFIRTLDIADEGHPFFVDLAGEPEPVLGMRGIRLSLAYPDIFKSQLRAIIRAARHGNLRIVLPMVSSTDEIVQGRRLIEEVYDDLQRCGLAPVSRLQVGAMLEVPAAVLELASILRHADFLLVGTNDLIQYTLAVGRSNQRIAHLFNPYHPAILRSLSRAVRLASECGRLAMICGEVASSPVYSRLLVGMGFQNLSMNPLEIPRQRRLVREMNFGEARGEVEEILRLETIAEVEEFVRERLDGAEYFGLTLEPLGSETS